MPIRPTHPSHRPAPLRRRAGAVLLATAGLLASLVFGVAPASAAPARAASAFPPPCVLGPAGYNYPYPACVAGVWNTSTTVPTITGAKLSATHRVVHRGRRYSYELVTVTAQFANSLTACPAGGVPLQDLPCQFFDAGLRLVGRWAGHRLDTAWSGGTDCGPITSGTCTYTFRIYHLQYHGLFVGVFALSLTDMTAQPIGSFADTGFGFDMSLWVPKNLH